METLVQNYIFELDKFFETIRDWLIITDLNPDIFERDEFITLYWEIRQLIIYAFMVNVTTIPD